MLIVKCDRCHQEIDHRCNLDVKKALEALLTWVPDGGDPQAIAGLKKAEFKQSEEDRQTPFFGSQGWSYAILGKHDARTFHALINQLIVALGYNPDVLMDTFEAEREAERKALRRRK